MSKKAIKIAEKNADSHGYLCGLESYECNFINVEKHENALYNNIRALELLEILDWDSAHELLSPIFDKAKQRAYTERQVPEELKQNNQKGVLKMKSFTVETSDGLVWRVHHGHLAPDFIQAYIIKAKKKSDIGAGFSAQLSALCGELADKIKEQV